MNVVARESWTDERLDDLKERVDDGFRRMDERFALMDQRFVQLDARVDSLHKTMVHGFIAMAAVQVAGFAAILGLVATQL
ncbi:MAG: hypothetical protein QOF23_1096 [Solirubrobacterales bacterium]|jgi:hypothetical protein|nr:hypothetical protein [Solirubrobacterales bacterium]MEA3036083.1 hypothetical protein [Sphingomonadales bacterium]